MFKKDLELVRADFKKAIYDSKIRRQNRIEIKSVFNFLTTINGWRKGTVSVILGTTSSGKSTLIRSIIFDLLKNNKKLKISCYLSEETADEYSLEIYKSFQSISFEQRVNFYCEQDCTSEDQMASRLSQAFESDSDVMILDNITTSLLYNSKRPEEQSKFANHLKIRTKQTNKVLIVVAHTNNVDKMSSKMISSSDIRGSKNISNLAEFFFINYQINRGDDLYNYIHIEKHRGQNPEARIFQVQYNKKHNIFYSDVVVKFDDFKEMWKGRNKL